MTELNLTEQALKIKTEHAERVKRDLIGEYLYHPDFIEWSKDKDGLTVQEAIGEYLAGQDYLEQFLNRMKGVSDELH